MSINEFAHRVIRASAGSGKTYKLSERFLKLLLLGVPVDSILATTFSRKAAGEILNRILERLARGALSTDGASKLSNELYKDNSRLTREQLRDLTVSVTRSLDRLRICTLDSFFNRIAKGFQFEIGLPPNWRIVEKVDDALLLRRAMQAAFALTSSRNAHELAKLLFKGESKRNVESRILEIAYSALAIFRASKEEAWNALGQCIPETKSLEECVDALNAAELPKNKTKKKSDDPLDQYDSSFVKARKHLIEFLESNNWKDALGKGFCPKILDGSFFFSRKPIEGDLLEALKDVVAFVKAQQLNAIVQFLTSLHFLLGHVDRYYRQFKREFGAYQFNDLSSRLAQLQMKNQLQRVVYRLDAKTSHLLLDEFQDSSLQQWAIIRPFAESITQRRSDSLNLENPDDVAQLTTFFCVGDVKQAIYGWRGGVAEIFQAIEETLPNLEKEGMETNWRSCPTIIEVVNKIFGGLQENSLWSAQENNGSDREQMKATAINNAVKKWCDYFQEHEVAEKNPNKPKPGYWALEVAPRYDEEDDPVELSRNKFTPINRSNGEIAPALPPLVPEESLRIETCELDDEEDEGESATERQKATTVAYAVRRIAQLHQQYPEYSIGVLVRTNRYLASIMRGLKAAGVKASSEGGVPIVDAPSTLAALSLFKLAAHPGDSVAAFHIANVAPLAEKYDVTTINYKDAARRVSASVRERIETIGLGRFASETRELLQPLCVDVQNRERLDKFVEFAFSYQANEPQVVLDRFINAVQAAKKESPAAENVRVMTIHASKGLEFDIVVLPELDCGSQRDLVHIDYNALLAGHELKRDPSNGKLVDSSLTPINRVIKYVNQDEFPILPEEFQRIFTFEMQKQLEEALCLFYVAITRPVRMLVAIINPIPHNTTNKTNKTKKNKENGEDGEPEDVNPLETPASKTLSFANILRRALAGNTEKIEPNSPYFKHAQIVYHEGESNWADYDSGENVKSKQAEATEENALGAPSFQRGSEKRLLRKRESPTGGRERLQWSPASSYKHGTAIHACFELVEWLDESGVPSDEQLKRVLEPIFLDSAKVAKTVKEFKEICERQYAKRLLSRSSYERPEPNPEEPRAAVALDAPNPNASWRVFRERPFALRDGDSLMRGIIDRLVLLYDGDKVVAADVVDYKTDRFPDKNNQFINDPALIPQETVDEYRRQLAVYARVVQEWYDLPKEAVSLRLAFVAYDFTIDARS